MGAAVNRKKSAVGVGPEPPNLVPIMNLVTSFFPNFTLGRSIFPPFSFFPHTLPTGRREMLCHSTKALYIAFTAFS